MNIRVATLEDAEAIAEIYAPSVRDTAISFEETPPRGPEMARRIAATLPTHPWLVALDQDQVLGYAYATQHRSRAAYKWSADVSVYVASSAQWRGLAYQLYTRLFACLVEQGYVSVFAGIVLPNQASVGFHERMQFEPVGVYSNVGFKQGAWRDVGWWKRALQTPPPSPEPPRPFRP